MNFSHITWLDDRGHIKPPVFLYLMLAFFARGWCIFIASLTQASDRAGLVKLFYPEKSDFLLALATGVGALLVYALVIAERRRAPELLRPLFARIYWLLWLLAWVDAGFLLQRLQHANYLFSWSFGLDGLALFWCSLYLIKSKRLRFYLADWTPTEADGGPARPREKEPATGNEDNNGCK